MVKRATNYSRSGVTDWILQRVTAVILGVYLIVVLGFFISSSQVSFQSWQSFILSTGMRVFTVLAMASFVAHAWIGLWTVATDYIRSTKLRYVFHTLYSLVLITSFIWCVSIIFG